MLRRGVVLLLGTIFIAGGACLIAIFGVVPEGSHSLDTLVRLYTRPAFLAYFSILCVAVAAVCVIVGNPSSLGRVLLPLDVKARVRKYG